MKVIQKGRFSMLMGLVDGDWGSVSTPYVSVDWYRSGGSLGMISIHLILIHFYIRLGNPK